MGVSKSGFYKWLKRAPTKKEEARKNVVALVEECHKKHKSHGYRWVAAFIRQNNSITCSDNYIYKVFRFLGITSETKHKVHRRPRKERDKYPNLIFSTWETVDRPRQVIVSDMTAFHTELYGYYELTMYFDVYTKQILSWCLGRKRGDRMQFITALVEVVSLLETEGREEPTIIHTDQGSVYASMDYNRLIKDKNIIRSMSRAGKPTDNPVNESLNGWIKEELFVDFNLYKCKDSSDVHETISNYVSFFNGQRPCWSLNYDIPDKYYQKYLKGELEHKETFKNRTLSETPKFVQKKPESTFRKEKQEKTSNLSTSENQAEK